MVTQVMRLLRIKLLALVALLSVALPLGAWPGAQYFCRMMDRVMPACCCGHDESLQEVPGDQLRAADCCERLSAARGAGSTAARDADTRFHGPVLFTTLPTVSFTALPVASGVVPPALAVHAPLGQGPPLFLKNCSLLT